MESNATHLLIFTRYPFPGKAKTRLIPALTPLGAARLQRRMTEHAVCVARLTVRTAAPGGCSEIRVCCTGASRRDFRAWLGTDLQYTPQVSGNLGFRMEQAFDRAFRNGAGSALLIGTDVPGITSDILHQAIRNLRYKDMVLGRALDGGYYLIGMNAPFPKVFEGVDWGTGMVYEQTRANIRRLGLTLADLPALQDMDRPEDLVTLRSDPRFNDLFSGKSIISVVIPTLNESKTIGRLLNRLGRSEEIERIVVDGGSSDKTRDIAAREGAVVLETAGGRAFQQNRGAEMARGRILFFLHADTLPPERFGDRIRAALECPSTVAGAFRFRTDDGRPVMRLVEWVTNIRSGLFQMPYGDQGIFLEKRVFEEMGRFPSMPVMEDFALMRRLRSRGRVVTLSDAAVTSARRWQRLGVVRTTLINQMMVLGFLGGLPIRSLKRLYHK
ncbi:MAG: DUF2064 domain-containing protein [Desulfobacteraceae bacterium]|nr:MAG: DUF2064 domain-containing protein [Desulfobacteraceae bacterium]